MDKMKQTFRYLLKSVKGITVIGFLCILGTLVFTELIFNITNNYYQAIPSRHDVTLTAPLEVTAGISALLTGLIFLIVTFKVVLANGISRKTFLVANILVACFIAAAYSIFNILLVFVDGLFWPVTLSSQFFFPQIGWPGLWIFQFALYFLLITAGWFIALAYYRSSIPLKWMISLSPFVFYGLLKAVDTRLGGAIFRWINEYQHASMRMEIAPVTLLAYSILLCGLVYLLIRRAPLKD